MAVSPSASFTDISIESNMHSMRPDANFKGIESKSFKNLTHERTQTPVIKQDRLNLSLIDTPIPVEQVPASSKWCEIAKKALIAIPIVTTAFFVIVAALQLTGFESTLSTSTNLMSGTLAMMGVYAAVTMVVIPGTVLVLGLGSGLIKVNYNK